MPALHLTFDDGPDPTGTPLLLDLLRNRKARATFFVVGRRAAAHPDLVLRMVDEGHSVALHCDEHVRHSDRSSEWVRRDTSLALTRLTRFGIRPRLWRTPWGDTMPWTAQIADENDLRLVHWTVDTHDWRGDSVEQMFDDTGSDLTDGAIILAHDGIGPGAQRDEISQTIAYVERVAAEARDRGMLLEALA